MIRLILTLIVMFSLSACGSFQGNLALVKKGDWQAVGQRDGERGLPSRSLSELQSLAKKAGVQQADISDYESGYQAGLERYCNVGNAYDIGLSGMQYNGVCNNQDDGLQFQMEWQRGFNDFQIGGGGFL